MPLRIDNLPQMWTEMYGGVQRNGRRKKRNNYGIFEEREKGFEPSTLALARRCSTTELFPHGETPSLVAAGGHARQAPSGPGDEPRRESICPKARKKPTPLHTLKKTEM